MRGVGFLLVLLATLLLGPVGARAEGRDFVILFGTGASEITPEAQKVVTLIAERAAAQHPAAIDIAGYGDADAGGDTPLAERRAEAVIHALTAAGVAPALLRQVPPAPPAKAAGIPVHKVTVTFTP
jgi:OmpA family